MRMPALRSNSQTRAHLDQVVAENGTLAGEEVRVRTEQGDAARGAALGEAGRRQIKVNAHKGAKSRGGDLHLADVGDRRQPVGSTGLGLRPTNGTLQGRRGGKDALRERELDLHGEEMLQLGRRRNAVEREELRTRGREDTVGVAGSAALVDQALMSDT